MSSEANTVIVDEAAPLFEAAREASKCDLEAIRKRPRWDYAKAYKALFKTTPEQHRREVLSRQVKPSAKSAKAPAKSSPKRRGRVAG